MWRGSSPYIHFNICSDLKKSWVTNIIASLNFFQTKLFPKIQNLRGLSISHLLWNDKSDFQTCAANQDSRLECSVLWLWKQKKNCASTQISSDDGGHEDRNPSTQRDKAPTQPLPRQIEGTVWPTSGSVTMLNAFKSDENTLKTPKRCVLNQLENLPCSQSH